MEHIDTHRHDETDEQHDMLRHQRKEEAIRKLFEIGPQMPGYAAECMRVLALNRKRPRGHAGRIFLARDLKTRREIQRSRMKKSVGSDASAT